VEFFHRFPAQDVHIKGLDDSGVAAEVERRRIEAERERRERERKEAQSRTDEREAAAHFRLSIWRVSWKVNKRAGLEDFCSYDFC
jgi:hypothetical protein